MNELPDNRPTFKNLIATIKVLIAAVDDLQNRVRYLERKTADKGINY